MHCALFYTQLLFVWQPCNAALHDFVLGKAFKLLLLGLRLQEAFLGR